MRLLVQVVKEASVTVENTTIGKIGRGLLIFFGAHVDDKPETCEWIADKITNLRIFPDENDKMNLSVKDVGASILIVSQFTLYADCSQGRRPSFTDAAPPPRAKELYDKFVATMKSRLSHVETGQFGSYMIVSLINDGPLTFIIDSQ